MVRLDPGAGSLAVDVAGCSDRSMAAAVADRKKAAEEGMNRNRDCPAVVLVNHYGILSVREYEWTKRREFY